MADGMTAAEAAADPRELLLALQRARDDADRRAREAAVVIEVLETMLRPQPPARLVLRVLRLVRRIIPFLDAVVLETAPCGGLVAGFSTVAGRLGTRWPHSAVFARARAGEVVNLFDIARVPELAPVVVPMLGGGGALLFALPSTDPGPPPVVLLHAEERGGFTPDMARTVRRLAVVAGQAQVSLEARRLRESTATLAREKAASEEALVESGRRETLVRGVLEAIPVGIYLKDEAGRFRYANGAAQRMIGRSNAELLGRLPSDVLPLPLGTAKDAEDRALLSGALASPLRAELLFPPPQGAPDPAMERRVELTKSAVQIDGQRLLVGTLLDVTERRRAEAAILAAKEAAEASNRAKTEFIATVSHEIRTPLNGILGMTQALLARPLATADRQALRVVKGSGDLLLGLIDNILNVAAIEAGKLDIRPVEVDAAALLHQVAVLWEERARAKDLDLVRVIDGAMPSAVRVDALRVSQVLNNLLGNAVKFTTAGGVVLRAGFDPGPDGAGLLQVAVEDTGPGIPHAARAQLFRRFSQVADSDRKRQLSGTGLGLSICQDLVRMMGGEIGHADRPGGGSIFRFSLPVPVPDARPRFGLPLAGRGALVAPAGDCGPEGWRLDRMAEVLASMGARVARAPGAPPVLVACAAQGAAGYAALRAAAPAAMRPLLDAAPKVVFGRAPAHPPAPATHAVLRHATGPLTLYDAATGALGIGAPERPLLLEEEAAGAGAEEGFAGRRLLVVEDNEVNQAVARALLERLGLAVEFAWNGQEALSAVARQRPDAVLMDLQMPVMDGIEATRRLRAGGFGAPIIVCTANVLPEAQAACRAAGATAVLSKPLQRGALEAMLAELLAAPPATQPAPPPGPLEPMLADLRDTLGDEEARRIADLFREGMDERLAAIEAALAAGNLAAAGREAHALKSAAALVGARKLAALMAALERASAAGDDAAAMVAGAALEETARLTHAGLDAATANG